MKKIEKERFKGVNVALKNVVGPLNEFKKRMDS